MKKVIYSILLSLLVLMPVKVFAAGYISPSTGAISVQEGSSTSFTITAYNAVGDVSVSSSNPGVAVVSPGSWETGAIGDGQTKTGTFTVTGVGVGSATITLVIDGFSFDNEDVSGTRTIAVNVTAKPAPAPTPTPTPTPTPSNPTPSNPTPSNPTPSNPTPNTPADTRSTNTNLSSLTINGKAINPVDNVYKLEVGNYLENVEIAAKTADDKAKVSGTGNKSLKVGENDFSVVVTAENGSTKTYTVKVVRREYNVLSELDELLKLNKDAEIRISDTDKLIKDQLDKIRKSKNKVTLIKMSDDNKQVLYSLILDGKKIKSVDEFNLNIKKTIENVAAIEEAVNYADGIYIDFSECGDIPKGMILRLYVGDKYKENDKVNLYMYGSDKIVLLGENYTIIDGYIEFEVNNKNYHFISKAKVLNAESNKLNIWFIVSIVLGIIVIGLGGFILVGKLKKKENNNTTHVVDKHNDELDEETL